LNRPSSNLHGCWIFILSRYSDTDTYNAISYLVFPHKNAWTYIAEWATCIVEWKYSKKKLGVSRQTLLHKCTYKIYAWKCVKPDTIKAIGRHQRQLSNKRAHTGIACVSEIIVRASLKCWIGSLSLNVKKYDSFIVSYVRFPICSLFS
jgi:hypothetical protein